MCLLSLHNSFDFFALIVDKSTSSPYPREAELKGRLVSLVLFIFMSSNDDTYSKKLFPFIHVFLRSSRRGLLIPWFDCKNMTKYVHPFIVNTEVFGMILSSIDFLDVVWTIIGLRMWKNVEACYPWLECYKEEMSETDCWHIFFGVS